MKDVFATFQSYARLLAQPSLAITFRNYGFSKLFTVYAFHMATLIFHATANVTTLLKSFAASLLTELDA